MKVVLFVACEIAIVDERSGTLSLVGMMEQLVVAGFPSTFGRFCIVTTSVKEANDPDEIQTVLRMFMNDQPLFDMPVTIQFGGRNRNRSLGDMSGLVIPAPGTVKITLNQGESQLAAWEILVRPAGGPQFELLPPIGA